MMLNNFPGWLHQLHTDQQELQHLYEQYHQDHQACLLVAEAWDDDGQALQFVSDCQLSEVRGQGRICGTVAVRLKDDKDMAQPPGTVGEDRDNTS